MQFYVQYTKHSEKLSLVRSMKYAVCRVYWTERLHTCWKYSSSEITTTQTQCTTHQCSEKSSKRKCLNGWTQVLWSRGLIMQKINSISVNSKVISFRIIWYNSQHSLGSLRTRSSYHCREYPKAQLHKSQIKNSISLSEEYLSKRKPYLRRVHNVTFSD